jgi:hypothetical protein
VKTSVRSHWFSVLPAAFLLLQGSPLSGRDAPPDSLVRERLADIRRTLESGAPNAGRWWTGWLIGYGAATVGQGIVCATSGEKRVRQDMALGAVTTGLGVIGQLLTPMVPADAPDRLAALPETDPEERLNKLSGAETLLKECALREEEGRSWKVHALTGAVNLGSGLVAWLGFKRCLGDGLANFALNSVITEAQIWTQPTRAVHDYKDYLRRYSTSTPNRSNARPYIRTWFVHVVPGGIGITLCL